MDAQSSGYAIAWIQHATKLGLHRFWLGRVFKSEHIGTFAVLGLETKSMKIWIESRYGKHRIKPETLKNANPVFSSKQRCIYTVGKLNHDVSEFSESEKKVLWRKRWRKYAVLLGLRASWLGKSYSDLRGNFTVLGLSGPKNRVVIKSEKNGEIARITVLQLLKLAKPKK